MTGSFTLLQTQIWSFSHGCYQEKLNDLLYELYYFYQRLALNRVNLKASLKPLELTWI